MLTCTHNFKDLSKRRITSVGFCVVSVSSLVSQDKMYPLWVTLDFGVGPDSFIRSGEMGL